jgi:hypothetical protein
MWQISNLENFRATRVLRGPEWTADLSRKPAGRRKVRNQVKLGRASTWKSDCFCLTPYGKVEKYISWGKGFHLQLSLLQSDAVRQSQGSLNLPTSGFPAQIPPHVMHFNRTCHHTHVLPCLRTPCWRKLCRRFPSGVLTSQSEENPNSGAPELGYAQKSGHGPSPFYDG